MWCPRSWAPTWVKNTKYFGSFCHVIILLSNIHSLFQAHSNLEHSNCIMQNNQRRGVIKAKIIWIAVLIPPTQQKHLKSKAPIEQMVDSIVKKETLTFASVEVRDMQLQQTEVERWNALYRQSNDLKWQLPFHIHLHSQQNFHRLFHHLLWSKLKIHYCQHYFKTT